MSIVYSHVTKLPHEFYEGMPGDVKKRLSEVIENLNDVFPGIKEALGRASVQFAYSPRNALAKVIPNDTETVSNAGYYYPLNTIYFPKRGLRYSMFHEIAHALDFISGPLPSVTSKHLSEKLVIPYSLHALYPKGKMLLNDDGVILVDQYPRAAQLIFWAITSPRISRRNADIKSSVLQALTEGGFGQGETNSERLLASVKQNSFVTERFANLFEQFAWFKLSRSGEKFEGVKSGDFASAVFWEREWFEEYEHPLSEFMAKIITIPLNRSAKEFGEINKVSYTKSFLHPK